MKSRAAHSALSFAHEGILALLLAALLAGAAHLEPAFASAYVQQHLFSQTWGVALLAIPMTFIIITGGIDLSVGSTMALASVMLGMSYKGWNWPLPIACGAAIVAGGLCGAVNGFFVTRIRVHPLIVTLATMSGFRGLAEGIGRADGYSDFPDAFYALAKNAVHWHLGMPAFYALNDRTVPLLALQAAGWLFVCGAVAAGIFLGFSRIGSAIYAIGFNETAARYSGIRVSRIKLGLYTLSGLAAGVAGVLETAGQNTAKADVGTGMELEVITAVVLGGTSVFGGRGRMTGTVLGVALIHETRQFVKWHYHKDEWVSVVLGALLIVAVAAHALVSRRSSRK